jgi:hypothetical protein
MAESERGQAVDAATAGVVQGSSAGALPPGLPWPPIAQLIRWWRRPIQFFEGCARRYGDVFTIRFPRFVGVPGLPGSRADYGMGVSSQLDQDAGHGRSALRLAS